MGEMPAAHHSAPHKERLLWLVAIGFFMQSLDATILNTALPAMATELGESAHNTEPSTNRPIAQP